jgi:hypothetical protein
MHCCAITHVILQECIGGRKPIPIHANALSDMTLLSNTFQAMEFDFTADSTSLLKSNDSSSDTKQPQQLATWACRSRNVIADITANGTLDALLVWWHLLDSNGDIMYSTQPNIQNWQDHWVQVVLSLYINNYIYNNCTHSYIYVRMSHCHIDWSYHAHMIASIFATLIYQHIYIHI